MDKQWVVFYVSSHGFGHMTRCLAIMEELLETTDRLAYVASGAHQNNLARIYLARFRARVVFRDIRTDVGLVNKADSLEVDIPRLEQELAAFMAGWDAVVADEVANLQGKTVACVITDISIIGILVGEQLGVRNIGISNFTWLEQYEHFGMPAAITARFREVYAKLALFIAYDLVLPTLRLPVPIKQVGFVCRRFDPERIAAIRAQYGPSVFITLGKAVNLMTIQVDHWAGTIFTTSGIAITATGNANVVQLPVDTVDMHNYLAASDIVIAKAGWGTISEAVLSHRHLVLLEREGILEDNASIAALKQWGLAVSIKETDLAHIDMHAIQQLIAANIVSEHLAGYDNAVADIVGELVG